MNQAEEIGALTLGWIAFMEAAPDSPDRENCWWAYEKLTSWTANAPELAWESILLICGSTESEPVLANLAAGPLEDLLVAQGPRVIDRVERVSEADPAFRKLLGAVWRNAIPDPIWRRLKAVAGDPW